MADEGARTSIAERIAALKLDHVGRPPSGPSQPINSKSGLLGAKVAPPLPSRRPDIPHRPQSATVPPNVGLTSATKVDIGNLPADAETNGAVRSLEQKALMPKRLVKASPPALPPRRPSEAPQQPPHRPSVLLPEAHTRRESLPSRKPSTDSLSSTYSTASSISRTSTKTGTSIGTTSSGSRYIVRAPDYDPSKLPPLPPKREKSDSQTPRISLKNNKSSPDVIASSQAPPMLPIRSSQSQPAPAPRPLQPPRPKQSSLSMGFNNHTVSQDPQDGLKASAGVHGTPPPVPVASRPDLSKLNAFKPVASGASVPAQSPGACLKCRDFSTVDAHAARFPRQSLPSQDLGWLAQQLTAPFPSLTDKARALFTWLHYNIDYDTVAFFNNAVQPSTPASTLATGLAVCEGYAGLFSALATKCGLESVVVGGHGKGFGYAQPSPDSPLPPYNPGGHAWNAVKIDDNKWKLIDCCWGAGAVGGKGQPYKRGFSPHHFTRDNTDFGLSHFPADKRYFFREDGRPSISWEEYILGPSNGVEQRQIFNGFTSEEGIAVESFRPFARRLSVGDAQARIRFQFQKVCSHWNNEKNGKGKHYVYILDIGGIDGRKPVKLPFETNGMFWWVDVARVELGAPGQQVKIWAVTSFDDGDGRGVTVGEFRDKVGRVGMGFGGVAVYDIV